MGVFFFKEKLVFIFGNSVEHACIYLFFFFHSYAPLNIHGTAAHIHAWEQLNTDAGLRPSTAERLRWSSRVKCLTQGHLDQKR